MENDAGRHSECKQRTFAIITLMHISVCMEMQRNGAQVQCMMRYILWSHDPEAELPL